MSLIESMPPPTEAQKKGIQDLIAAQKHEYDEFYKQRAEEDIKAQIQWEAKEELRQAKRETDPAYWKRLYLDMASISGKCFLGI